MKTINPCRINPAEIERLMIRLPVAESCRDHCRKTLCYHADRANAHLQRVAEELAAIRKLEDEIAKLRGQLAEARAERDPIRVPLL